MSVLTVFGSINLDLAVRVPAFPVPGETVLGAALTLSPGGKGANQAHAARRFGVATCLVGAVGCDGFAEPALAGLRAAGVDLAGVKRLADAATGVACIAVAPGGENTIVVAPGANQQVRADWVADAALAASKWLLLQGEVPLAESMRLARRARAAGCRVVFNAAPASGVSAGQEAIDPQAIDWLVVNETELVQLRRHAGLAAAPDHEAALRLAQHWHVNVVLTRGAAGALMATPSGAGAQCPAPATRVVDTTGAGDTFAGVFAAALAAGYGPSDALQWGVVAASLACRAEGAQAAQPLRADIERTLGL